MFFILQLILTIKAYFYKKQLFLIYVKVLISKKKVLRNLVLISCLTFMLKLKQVFLFYNKNNFISSFGKAKIYSGKYKIAYNFITNVSNNVCFLTCCKLYNTTFKLLIILRQNLS